MKSSMRDILAYNSCERDVISPIRENIEIIFIIIDCVQDALKIMVLKLVASRFLLFKTATPTCLP